MTLTIEGVTTHPLPLHEELIVMLLNEESGVLSPGARLGPELRSRRARVLAELSLVGRIDTDMDSLIPLDRTEVGDPILDPSSRRLRTNLFNGTRNTGSNGSLLARSRSST